MEIENKNPYDTCPVFETGQFIYRLVEQEDAQDLLECYSDPLSAKIFNSDNCTSNFIYRTMDEMKTCIGFWLKDYARRVYVRFSIVDKITQRAVGTIECFAKEGTFPGFGTVGILRIDLPSTYENQSAIREILHMVEDNLYSCFGIQSMLTKAIPEAKQRINALEDAGYRELKTNPIMPYGDYYVRVR